MAFKWTVDAFFIYAGMWAMLLAVMMRLIRRRDLSLIAYGAGFLSCAISFSLRACTLGHAPLQGLYEVFLFLGMAMFPLTVFCRYVLGVRHDAADPLIALLVLFPAGFVFSGAPRQLPPALQSPLFIPHVMTYLLGYVVMVKAGLIAYRIMRRPQPMTPSTGASITLPVAMDRLVRLGFPLLTAGLLLGAVWGKLAWGDWWNWDPKEMWSLATWLVFVLYFHLSAGTASRVRLRAAVVVAGVALVIITLLWVNLSRIFAGLHNYAT